MDERHSGEDPLARRPAVVCLGCEFGWHTARMAEGLRLLGSCPRCGGELEFVDTAAAAAGDAEPAATEPHLALGLPRPPRR